MKPDNDTTQTEQANADSANTEQSQQHSTETTPQVVWTDETGKGWTADEIKAGHLRQEDYTRKTQEIAELRKTAEQQIAEANQIKEFVQERLPAFTEYDPVVIDFLTGRIDKLPAKEMHFDTEEAKTLFELKNELAGFKKESQIKVLTQQLEQGFAKVKELDPDYNQVELKKFMQERQIFDPVLAYQAMAFPLIHENTKKQVEAEYAERKRLAEAESLKNANNNNDTRHTEAPPPTASLRERINYALDKA